MEGQQFIPQMQQPQQPQMFAPGQPTQPNFEFKIVLVGDGGTGKVNLIHKIFICGKTK